MAFILHILFVLSLTGCFEITPSSTGRQASQPMITDSQINEIFVADSVDSIKFNKGNVQEKEQTVEVKRDSSAVVTLDLSPPEAQGASRPDGALNVYLLHCRAGEHGTFLTSHGVITVIDLQNLVFSYAPNPGYIGTDFFVVVVVSEREDEPTFQVVVTIDVEAPVRVHKPSLAVDSMGCMMCHAKIKSNIITTFAWGKPWFFGQVREGSTTSYSGSVNGDHVESWKATMYNGRREPRTSWDSATIAEGFQVTVPGDAVLPATDPYYPNMPLATYMAERKGKPTNTMRSIDINSPRESEILAMVDRWSHEKWEYRKSGINAPDLRGLSVVSLGNNTAYVMADGELHCSGDLFIRETLLLRNLVLHTDNAGCRIYVTRSVFIQGTIRYAGEFPLRNLQISSSRAIVLGVGANQLHSRFITMWTAPSMHHDDPSFSLGDVYTEAYGIANQRDASGQYARGRDGTRLYADASEQNSGNREVHFERLLLHAPHVHSRYTGNFKGVIVAGEALFSLGRFMFEYDPVFDQVLSLPRLSNTQFLDVSE